MQSGTRGMKILRGSLIQFADGVVFRSGHPLGTFGRHDAAS
jgi:hypothetical protein